MNIPYRHGSYGYVSIGKLQYFTYPKKTVGKSWDSSASGVRKLGGSLIILLPKGCQTSLRNPRASQYPLAPPSEEAALTKGSLHSWTSPYARLRGLNTCCLLQLVTEKTCPSHWNSETGDSTCMAVSHVAPCFGYQSESVPSSVSQWCWTYQKKELWERLLMHVQGGCDVRIIAPA